MKPSQSFVSFDPLKPGPISFCLSNITSSSIQSNVCFLTPCLCSGSLKDVPVGLKFPRINFSSQVIYFFGFFSWKVRTGTLGTLRTDIVSLKKQKKNDKWSLSSASPGEKNSLSMNKLGGN